MTLPPQVSNFAPPAALGASGLSLPWWLEYVPPVWQGLIAALGFGVLLLTFRKLWIENKLADRKLRESDGGR